MEITDIYINSSRLVNSVSLSHIRYLYDTIDWSSRMICVKGARGVGKTKTFEQIKDLPDSYLAIDDVEYGTGKRIPLWLFGFLY